jgi:hypothetical protein
MAVVGKGGAANPMEHRDVQYEMHVMTIVKVGCFDVNQVRRVTEQQLVMVWPSFSGGRVKQPFQLVAGQKVKGETSVVRSL